MGHRHAQTPLPHWDTPPPRRSIATVRDNRNIKVCGCVWGEGAREGVTEAETDALSRELSLGGPWGRAVNSNIDRLENWRVWRRKDGRGYAECLYEAPGPRPGVLGLEHERDADPARYGSGRDVAYGVGRYSWVGYGEGDGRGRRRREGRAGAWEREAGRGRQDLWHHTQSERRQGGREGLGKGK